MPVQMQCTHKGCMKVENVWIDPKTDKVYCGACDRELSNITHFTKVQLKTLKQYRVKKTTAFSVKCGSCQKEATPIIENNDVCCSGCLKPLNNLSPIFKNMLKEQLNKRNTDE